MAPELSGAGIVTGQGRFGRASVICWTLVQVGMSDNCRPFASRFPPELASSWFLAEAAAAEGDAATAVPILEKVGEFVPPGNPQTVMAMDLLATLHERRGDLDAAAATLARSDAARVTVYPNSGSRGFLWLRAQAHRIRIERRRGQLERAAAIQQQLDRLLALADGDFTLGPLVP